MEEMFNSNLELERIDTMQPDSQKEAKSSLFSSPSSINEILSSITRGFQKMEALHTEVLREFAGKLKYDVQKDKQIDRLHDELEAYRDNLVLKSVMPILEDIIFEIESNKKRVKILKEKEDVSVDKLFNVIEDYCEDLSGILFRQGIETYYTVGEKFDAKIHTLSKVIETSDIEDENVICDSLRSGYKWEEKILKKEIVNIYKYKEIENAYVEEEEIYG